MDAWSHRALSELCTTITVGHVGTMAGEYKPSGIPFLRSKNVRPGRLDLADLAYVGSSFHEDLKKSQLLANDIVIVRTGTPGSAALIPESFGEANCSDIIIARPTKQVSPRFLCYAINATAGAFVSAHTVGAVQQHFNIGSARKLQIHTPPLHEQQGIADVLGALDDKIALNSSLVANARSLGLTHLRHALATRSVHQYKISDITTCLTRGGAPKYVDSSEGIPVINQKCIRDGYVDLAKARFTTPSKSRADRFLQTGDVLVNSTGVGTLGRVARWPLNEQVTVDSHVTIVRFDAERVDPMIGAYAMLLSQPLIENMGEGSTGQTDLSRAKLASFHLTVPSEAIATLRLRGILQSLEDSISAARMENQTLAALRDTLLPQLVTGKIRIKDVEKAVEDAA
ncbi:restriction endonuclease subunit S [Streptomyces sp. NPDC055239]